jgi:hypothetical protein
MLVVGVSLVDIMCERKRFSFSHRVTCTILLADGNKSVRIYGRPYMVYCYPIGRFAMQ